MERHLFARLDESLGRASAAWIDHIRPRAGLVIVAFLLLAIAAAGYAFSALGVNTNENDLFSEDLPYFALRQEFERAFPDLVDPIVVVIDGATVDLAHEATDVLARRLERDTRRFGRVHRPGSGPFFDRHAFLYLEIEELEDLVDNLFTVQPYLAELSRDTSLRGFLSMLAVAVDATARGDLEGFNLSDVLDRVGDVVGAHLEGRGYRLSWADVITGRDSTPRDRRRYLLVQPMIDFQKLRPAETSLLALREILEELGFDGRSGVRVRATGVFPLSYEEMEHLNQQTTRAGAASFVLVGIILLAGLGSPRLVGASLLTLLVGLALTAGFAAVSIGHLNLISVAFAVLFIGLSIDFAIHICMRFREMLSRGHDRDDALRRAAEGVGSSLVLCAATTALGFYAFAPTEYAGVAELGIIAGSGMLISLFTNMTLLPALILWGVPAWSVVTSPPSLPRLAGLLALPVRHARAVVAVTALLAVAGLTLLPRIHFDSNPLRVRDPSTDSVQVFNEMLADGDALPWNLNILAPDLESGRATAERLDALAPVDFALTLVDFVPEDQAQKLDVLEDAAFVLLPTLAAAGTTTSPSAQEQLRAVEELERSLAALDAGGTTPALAVAAARLRESLEELRERWSRDGDESAKAIEALETALIGSLPEQLRILRTALEPGTVALADLPDDLVERMTATDGRARIEIFPAEDLNEQPALEAYVRTVQEIAPDAFGEGLVILETGRVVVRSLQQALATAAVLIALLLVVLWRNWLDALLVALPLALASLFTAASGVLLGVPFNFANVIVIPLLLGMGVDTGIHLVHRYRIEKLPDGNLLHTSTAGAVVLSSLTTAASFGTLGLSSHLGMASLGRLLTLGISLILVCNLVVLPALARVTGRAR
jgi:hopanoid biosynthesis associated RND transporter like protein HpnN